MNKYPNPETEEKSSHPIRNTILIIAAILVVSYFLFGDKIIAAMITAENNTKQPAGITVNADNPDINNINNPAGETFECDLTFLDMDRRDLATLKINPNSDKLQADTEYIIRFDFPDMLRAEIENETCDFELAAKYEFEVQESHRAHFQVKVYNRDTGNLYVANGAILATDDLCLKHCFGKNSSSISSWINFEEDCFEFSVYTSALPDAGPKTTSSASSGGWGYNLNYAITGMTANEWEIPYE